MDRDGPHLGRTESDGVIEPLCVRGSRATRNGVLGSMWLVSVRALWLANANRADFGPSKNARLVSTVPSGCAGDLSNLDHRHVLGMKFLYCMSRKQSFRFCIKANMVHRLLVSQDFEEGTKNFAS